MKKFLIAAVGLTALSWGWAVYAAYYYNGECNGLTYGTDPRDAVQPSSNCDPSAPNYPCCISYHYEDYCWKCLGYDPQTESWPQGSLDNYTHCYIIYQQPVNWTSYGGTCSDGICYGDPDDMLDTETDDYCDPGINSDGSADPTNSDRECVGE
jgi:hypothetical protein